MKINFSLPKGNGYHQYCVNCHSEKVHRVYIKKETYYYCPECNKTSPRMLVIDPKVVWWVDKKTNEYWHESIGIFLTNQENKILFFGRTIYPFKLAIPAGHLDTGESPEEAIIREVFEETGLKINNIKLFSEEDVIGDSCRRGADNHHWHLYVGKLSDSANVKLNDEGAEWYWLSLDEVKRKELVFPVKYFIDKYGQKLLVYPRQ